LDIIGDHKVGLFLLMVQLYLCFQGVYHLVIGIVLRIGATLS